MTSLEDKLEQIDWGDERLWGFYSDTLPESSRDAGYKNAAYALGELVDNSIQADAADVDLIMFESNIRSIKGRRSWLVYEIGILDNGVGMDPVLQRASIKFQDGSHQRGLKRGGKTKQMGKFGVGLPQASISQARRVEVYTWTDGGHENATYTYIDFDEPLSFNNVPRPIMKKIPEKWLGCSEIWDNSGTLVIWSKLDRFSWKTSKSVHRNTEYVVGRMYRRHISEDGLGIRIAAYENDSPWNPRWTDRDGDNVRSAEETHDWIIKANDPLYLDPEAFAGNPPESPAFKDAGSEVLIFNITDKEGKTTTEEVTLRFSIAKQVTREGHGFDRKKHKQGLGGKQEHGKHANNNLGLSIVRARRELELDDGYSVAVKDAAWERWWGAEVSFEPGMDEVLRVTNNKQHAQALNDVSKKEWESFGWDNDESVLEIKERLEWEDFSTFVSMTIKEKIEKNLKILRDQIRTTSVVKKISRTSRHEGAEEQASKAITKRQKEGKVGSSDLMPDMPEEERRETLRASLDKQGIDGDLIDHLEGKIIDSGYKMVFSERKMDSEAFFSVQKEIGSLIVFVNENHAAYKHLFAALDSVELKGDELSKEALQQRAIHASQAVKLLLGSWARYEDESLGSEDKKKLLKARREWGSVAESIMDDFAGGYSEI